MAFRLVLLTLALTLLPAVAVAAPGDLDRSFDGDGIATYDWGGADSAMDALVQPDGRIVVVGFGGAGVDFQVERLNRDGGPDTGFSSDGLVSIPLTDSDSANAVARQPDGKIVAVGHTTDLAQTLTGAVVRLNADGTPDGSFSGDGIATLDASLTDVVVQPDGKIVATGIGGVGLDGFVTRLTPDGLPDPTFDGDGTATFDFGGRNFAEKVTLHPDGRLVVFGYNENGGMWVLSLNADGTPDTSFSDKGFRPLEPHTGDYPYDVLVQPDGKIVLIGGADGAGFLVSRLTSDGSFDRDFATGEGIAVVNFGASDVDYPGGAVLQANGKLVVAGSTRTGTTETMAVARLQPAGSLDTTFSSDGQQTLSGIQSHAYGVALQPDGGIVLAGGNDQDALVARFEGDGGAAGGGPPGGGGGGAGGGTAIVPRCAGKRATIVGSSRSDRLKGTRRADVIVALGGNDRIVAGRGNDLICAGNGNDAINGGLGNDRLFGQNGRDKIGGGSGKDQLSGGSGKDRLTGGGGKDSCAGNAGRDTASCERGRA